MEIKMNKWTKGHESVFRVSGLDGNCCKVGQRFPTILTQIHSVDELHVVTGITTKTGSIGNFHRLLKVPTGKWFKIEISQTKNSLVKRLFTNSLNSSFAYF